MKCRILRLALLFAASVSLLVASSAFAANELENGSFESPNADPEVPDAGAPWDNFGAGGTRFTTNAKAFDGDQSLKTFGPFDFIGGGTGAQQQVPGRENAPYDASIWARHNCDDALQGLNFGVYKTEFLDANKMLVGGLGEPPGTPLEGFNVFTSAPIDAASPCDEWIELTAGGVSPPGTAFARSVLVQVQGGDGAGNFVGGAVFWDDAFLMQVPEPTSMTLVGFSGLAVLLMRRKR